MVCWRTQAPPQTHHHRRQQQQRHPCARISTSQAAPIWYILSEFSNWKAKRSKVLQVVVQLKPTCPPSFEKTTSLKPLSAMSHTPRHHAATGPEPKNPLKLISQRQPTHPVRRTVCGCVAERGTRTVQRDMVQVMVRSKGLHGEQYCPSLTSNTVRPQPLCALAGPCQGRTDQNAATRKPVDTALRCARKAGQKRQHLCLPGSSAPQSWLHSSSVGLDPALRRHLLQPAARLNIAAALHPAQLLRHLNPLRPAERATRKAGRAKQ